MRMPSVSKAAILRCNNTAAVGALGLRAEIKALIAAEVTAITTEAATTPRRAAADASIISLDSAP
jgi:hypothetical protein